ncbi:MULTISPECIES: MarR family winged helix-turn-helix transcriptional regulator [Rhizobium]|nr:MULTISPECIES: MarR family transcriptional regulator [Rhizobium]PCK81939.1 MarR family transcriptional regulator [Rhizobium sophoriradicis]UWU33390.1 MarR family transcriptional regulator [Rhizobium leguminosarum bv. phaseoli]
MQDPLKLDVFICFAVYTASHALNRVYKPLLDTLGLTYPQYLAMVALWEQDDQTVSGLGEKLYLESSTLTPLLKRLESAGYIRRERSREDERVVVIRLSEAGIRLKEKAIGIPGCIAEASGRDAADLTRLRAEIVALREALNGSVNLDAR